MEKKSSKKSLDTCTNNELYSHRAKFRHPWARISTSVIIVFLDFFIYAEDPVQDSAVDLAVPMGGTVANLFLRLPKESEWRILQIFLIVVGIPAGGSLGHWVHRFLSHYLQISMFTDRELPIKESLKKRRKSGRKERPTMKRGNFAVMGMMIMFTLYVIANIINLFHANYGNKNHVLDDFLLGITYREFSKWAQRGTWLGDLWTIVLVWDGMFMQHKYTSSVPLAQITPPDISRLAPTTPQLGNKDVSVVIKCETTLTCEGCVHEFSKIDRVIYSPYYGKWAENWKIRYKRDNFRYAFLSCMSLLSTFLVFWSISYSGTCKKCIFKYGNYTILNEVGRGWVCFLITLIDLTIVIQDWEFPSFHHDGEDYTGTDEKVIHSPKNRNKNECYSCLKNLPEKLNLQVDQKWATYGPLLVIIGLDFKLMAQQMFYTPSLYGQYVCNGRNLWTIRNKTFIKQFYVKGLLIENITTFTCDTRKLFRNRTLFPKLYDVPTGFFDSTSWGTKGIAGVASLFVLVCFLLFGVFYKDIKSTEKERQVEESRINLEKLDIIEYHKISLKEYVERAETITKKVAQMLVEVEKNVSYHDREISRSLLSYEGSLSEMEDLGWAA